LVLGTRIIFSHFHPSSFWLLLIDGGAVPFSARTRSRKSFRSTSAFPFSVLAWVCLSPFPAQMKTLSDRPLVVDRAATIQVEFFSDGSLPNPPSRAFSPAFFPYLSFFFFFLAFLGF